jgi:hypothetical protein
MKCIYCDRVISEQIGGISACEWDYNPAFERWLKGNEEHYRLYSKKGLLNTFKQLQAEHENRGG